MRNDDSPRTKITCAVLLLLVLNGVAAAHQTVLGPQGEIYKVELGPYGELFPEENAALAEAPVLALDVVSPGQTRERWLVPGTAGNELESAPSLVLEKRSGSLFLVWASTSNLLSSSIHLVVFEDSRWSAVIEVSGDPFSRKTAPQVAVTRDSYALPNASGDLDTYERTILHTLWWEESGIGEQVVYAPLVLLDGEYIGWNPVHVLNDLDPGTTSFSGFSAGPLSHDLLLSPALRPGRDLTTVVAALTNPSTGQLLTLEARVLPGELSHLAGAVRAQIIDIGARACAPGTARPGEIASLAHRTWTYMTQIGKRFHSGVLSSLAGEVRAQIIDIGARVCGADPNGMESLAAAIYEHILEAGAEVLESGLRSLSAPVRAQIIDIGAFSEVEGHFHENLQLRVASLRPAPTTGDGPTTVYLSPSGQDVLVAWEEGDGLRYRESLRGDAGWSPVFYLGLDDDLTLEQAHEILRQRLESR